MLDNNVGLRKVAAQRGLLIKKDFDVLICKIYSTHKFQMVLAQLIKIMRAPCYSNILLRSALSVAILTVLYPSFVHANPTGASIVSGQVTIDTATPHTTTVTNSPNAIVNWQNFSIAQNEATHFIQQSSQSAVLNRVVGQNPSQILGHLYSNGKVFLISA